MSSMEPQRNRDSLLLRMQVINQKTSISSVARWCQVCWLGHRTLKLWCSCHLILSVHAPSGIAPATIASCLHAEKPRRDQQSRKVERERLIREIVLDVSRRLLVRM